MRFRVLYRVNGKKDFLVESKDFSAASIKAGVRRAKRFVRSLHRKYTRLNIGSCKLERVLTIDRRGREKKEVHGSLRDYTPRS